jgi:tetratricopeptide (TPR) repeat protein
VNLKADSSRAHEARVHIGKCYEAKGDATQAIAAYRAALEAAGDAGDVIEVSDELAKVLVKAGQLDEADETIRHAEDAVRDELQGSGPDAARVRKALDAMGARKALQRARDKSAGAHQDAQQLDKGR